MFLPFLIPTKNCEIPACGGMDTTSDPYDDRLEKLVGVTSTPLQVTIVASLNELALAPDIETIVPSLLWLWMLGTSPLFSAILGPVVNKAVVPLIETAEAPPKLSVPLAA